MEMSSLICVVCDDDDDSEWWWWWIEAGEIEELVENYDLFSFIHDYFTYIGANRPR